MSVDLETQLAELGAQWSSSVPHVQPSDVFLRLELEDDRAVSVVGDQDPGGSRVGSRTRRWVLAVAAACVLVLVGGLVANITTRGREPKPAASPGAVTTLDSVSEAVTTLISVDEAGWTPPVDRITVVAAPGNPFEVAVGSSSGIRVGMPVVNAAGLVGKIVSVSADRSEWMPVTDNLYTVLAKADGTQPPSSTGVTIWGQGSGKPLQLRIIDPAAASTFAVGDLVVTAGGSESLAPADIPIGRISASVTANDSGANLFEVTPIADLAAWDSVTILLYLPASAGHEPESTAPTYIDEQPVVPNELLDIPLDYVVTIDEAIQLLTRDCMEAQGFTYLFPPAPATPVREPAVRDAEDRQTHGYGEWIPHDEPGLTAFAAQLDDPAWDAAWQGTDIEGDGCSGQAIATVYPPEGLPQGPARGAYTEAVNAWQRDITGSENTITILSPLFESATADWAACMTASGYATTSPIEFANTVIAERSDVAAGTPSATEVTKALDDWACQLSTDYVNRVFGYLQQSTQQFASANASLLNAANTEYVTQLGRARQIIEQH